MDIDFFVINGLLGIVGAFLVLRRYRHMGLLLAGLSLVGGATVAIYGERWWPTLAGAVIATLIAKVIGNPLEP